MKTVSIIIPCFNQAEYVPDSIESALNQREPCEVIFISDGSTDKSLEIAKSYESRGLKVIDQINKGLSSARNTGIMNATGDIILPLDADDILMPNCVEKILQKFLLTDADVVSPSFKCFGIGNETVILMDSPKLADFRTGNRIGYCSAIKKSALLEVGGYSSRMIHGYEDYHLWFNLLSVGKRIETISEVLWLYRIKEKSMWRDSLNHHKELMEQIYKDFPNVFPV